MSLRVKPCSSRSVRFRFSRSSSITLPSSRASTRYAAPVMLNCFKIAMALAPSVLSISPSSRISSIGARSLAVNAGNLERLASNLVCSSASIPMPCIHAGSVSRLDPFFRSTVMSNASPVNKSMPMFMLSFPPRSPPTLTVRAWTKSFTTLPKSTRSLKKKESASMPSSSPKVGKASPSESTSEGSVRLMLAGSGSK